MLLLQPARYKQKSFGRTSGRVSRGDVQLVSTVDVDVDVMAGVLATILQAS